MFRNRQTNRHVQYLVLRKWEKPRRGRRRPKYAASRGICRKHKEQTDTLPQKAVMLHILFGLVPFFLKRRSKSRFCSKQMQL